MDLLNITQHYLAVKEIISTTGKLYIRDLQAATLHTSRGTREVRSLELLAKISHMANTMNIAPVLTNLSCTAESRLDHPKGWPTQLETAGKNHHFRHVERIWVGKCCKKRGKLWYLYVFMLMLHVKNVIRPIVNAFFSNYVLQEPPNRWFPIGFTTWHEDVFAAIMPTLQRAKTSFQA